MAEFDFLRSYFQIPLRQMIKKNISKIYHNLQFLLRFSLVVYFCTTFNRPLTNPFATREIKE